MQPNPRFEVYEDKAGKWRWRLISGGDIIADSAQGYASKEGALRGIESVKKHAPGAPVVDGK
jgi:uncharacterized protein YegP (UPF0339 family)